MPNTRDLRKKAQQARRAASIQTDDRMIDREPYWQIGVPAWCGIGKRHEAGPDASGAEMQMHADTRLQREIVLEQPQLRIEASGRGVQRWRNDPIAALNPLPLQIRPGKIERATLTGLGALRWPIVRLDTADAQIDARRA